MLEWWEQFSMATWLSSHKEKQVRQDLGHVDSADDLYHSCWLANLACYILCSIDMIKCYEFTKSPDSSAKLLHCEYLRCLRKEWSKMTFASVLPTEEPYRCCKEFHRAKHCLWTLCHSPLCIPTLHPITFWNLEFYDVFSVRKVYSRLCSFVRPCLGVLGFLCLRSIVCLCIFVFTFGGSFQYLFTKDHIEWIRLVL